ncbi:hypothetical protein WMY93_010120 [Mugilogobius chulae]|uniref:Uncharacterized protein n=1 Tax=Mugilogobius chulae TaxID=88201 RepID=A0AAW0PHX7_9GOBI
MDARGARWLVSGGLTNLRRDGISFSAGMASNPSLKSSESQILVSILDQVRQLQRSVSVNMSPGCPHLHGSVWAKRINAVFVTLYILVVALFLPFMYKQWTS